MQTSPSLPIDELKTRALPADGAPAGDDVSSRLFIERLRKEAKRHDYDRHPFHLRMSEGALGSDEIRVWVINTYYYHSRVPIADALILAKSEDPVFRRRWLRRIVEHDGEFSDEGGLALWHRLAAAIGIEKSVMHDPKAVLPGVRLACDAYLSLVREASLSEAVAASLTDVLLPGPLGCRLAAFRNHYGWIDADALDYFRSRIERPRRDSDAMLAYVAERAETPIQREACVHALVRKALILWHMLDCIQARGRASST